jgi:hypothetical protein
MDENHNSIETQPSWFAPWQWHRDLWIAALWHRSLWIPALMIPPLLYLLSVFMWESWARKNPEWRPVVRIINAPLEPLRRPFRRTATLP